jgi:hypothetical protein
LTTWAAALLASRCCLLFKSSYNDHQVGNRTGTGLLMVLPK